MITTIVVTECYTFQHILLGACGTNPVSPGSLVLQTAHSLDSDNNMMYCTLQDRCYMCVGQVLSCQAGLILKIALVQMNKLS